MYVKAGGADRSQDQGDLGTSGVFAMSLFARIDRHQKLMTRMADAQGVDIDLELQKGDLSPEAYRGAVLSCTACSQPDRCEAALNAGESGVPDYCRNATLIAQLIP